MKLPDGARGASVPNIAWIFVLAVHHSVSQLRKQDETFAAGDQSQTVR